MPLLPAHRPLPCPSQPFSPALPLLLLSMPPLRLLPMPLTPLAYLLPPSLPPLPYLIASQSWRSGVR